MKDNVKKPYAYPLLVSVRSGSVLPMYNDSGVLQDNPFEILDTQGLGQLIEMVVQHGRAAAHSKFREQEYVVPSH